MTRANLENVPKRRFSIEEYYRLAEVGILGPEDKVELIYGEIVKMSPIGPRHASIVICLNRLLHGLLKDKYLISPQNPVRLSSYSEPEPDLAVLKPRSDNYKSSHPSPEDVFLLIEISYTTFEYDSKVKLPLYAEEGIEEYWIIDLQEDRILVYIEPLGDIYQKQRIYRRGEGVINSLFPREVLVRELIGE